jgi:hypothetical protein
LQASDYKAAGKSVHSNLNRSKKQSIKTFVPTNTSSLGESRRVVESVNNFLDDKDFLDTGTRIATAIIKAFYKGSFSYYLSKQDRKARADRGELNRQTKSLVTKADLSTLDEVKLTASTLVVTSFENHFKGLIDENHILSSNLEKQIGAFLAIKIRAAEFRNIFFFVRNSSVIKRMIEETLEVFEAESNGRNKYYFQIKRFLAIVDIESIADIKSVTDKFITQMEELSNKSFLKWRYSYEVSQKLGLPKDLLTDLEAKKSEVKTLEEKTKVEEYFYLQLIEKKIYVKKSMSIVQGSLVSSWLPVARNLVASPIWEFPHLLKSNLGIPGEVQEINLSIVKINELFEFVPDLFGNKNILLDKVQVWDRNSIWRSCVFDLANSISNARGSQESPSADKMLGNIEPKAQKEKPDEIPSAVPQRLKAAPLKALWLEFAKTVKGDAIKLINIDAEEQTEIYRQLITNIKTHFESCIVKKGFFEGRSLEERVSAMQQADKAVAYQIYNDNPLEFQEIKELRDWSFITKDLRTLGMGLVEFCLSSKGQRDAGFGATRAAIVGKTNETKMYFIVRESFLEGMKEVQDVLIGLSQLDWN